MKQRIKEIMKKENLTASQFAEKTGIQRAALSHIIHNRNKPSLDVVMKIHQTFDYINLEWLMYGVGDPYKDSSLREELEPTLFDENALNSHNPPVNYENRRENEVKLHENQDKVVVKQEVKYIQKPSRNITEIRIFFDDNTYEIFKPER